MATQRLREESSYKAAAASRSRKITYCNNSTNVASVNEFGPTGTTKSMMDFVEPNFLKRKMAGEIMNHPMHSIKTEYKSWDGISWKVVYNPACTGTTIKTMEGNGLRYNNSPTYCGQPSNLIDVMNDLQNLVGTQVFASVEAPEWNAALFAAELDKTFKMFRPSIAKFQKTLGRAQKDYRRHLKSGGRAYARTMLGLSMVNGLSNWIASNWLRYRFGILPLIYDWEDFNSIVNETHLSPRLTSRAKAEHVFDEVSEYVTDSTSDVYFNYNITRVQNCTVTVRGGLLYEHDLKLSDRIGYNVQNVLPTAWELVPFSFVVDRIVNIGDLLSAAIPKVGVKELARWTKTSVHTVDECMVSLTPKAVNNFTVTCSGHSGSVRVLDDIQRSPVLQVGVVPKWKYIDLSKTVHQKHLADHIALFKTILLK